MTQTRTPNTARNTPTYPEIEAAINENPARFLTADLNPQPIIRGIHRPRRLAAWLHVEVDLARSHYDTDGPRRRVLQALHDRSRQLDTTATTTMLEYIDDPEALHAWLIAETRLGDNPHQGVLAAIQERARELGVRVTAAGWEPRDDADAPTDADAGGTRGGEPA